MQTTLQQKQKGKLLPLTKPNAMRRSAKDKKKALEKVEDELRELSKKSANLN